MAYNVTLTEAAENDVDQLLRYLTGKLGAENAAADFLTQLGEVMDTLAVYPQMYEFSSAPRLRRRGYRKFLIQKYVALYKVDAEQQTVQIARVFHGTMDYPKYL